MLQMMRRWSKSWISSLFLGGLAVSFAVWGIADVFRGNVSTTVASVGPVDISIDAYKEAYQRALKQVREETGQSLTPEQARAYGIQSATLDRMINRTALDNVAHTLGLVTTDKDVYAAIQADRAFTGPLGQFDRSTFERALQEGGYTEGRFIELERGDLTREQLLGPFAAAISVPENYIAAIVAGSNELRAVQYIVLTPESAGTIAPPSDAVLLAFQKAHAAEFSTPEFRSITYAYSSPADVMNGLTVTDAQIKQAYDAQSTTFNVPEKRTLERINFPSEADAAAAKSKIDGGQSFAQVAAARGLTPQNIAMGDMAASEMDPDLAKAAFALSQGAVSAPVKSPFGYTLVHVVAITPGKATSLADATAQIKADLLKQTAAAKLGDMANTYSSEVGNGFDIAEAAQKAGLRIGRIKAIDANGNGPDGKPAGAPTAPEFIQQMQKAEIGEAGDPFNTKDGSLFAIKVEGVTPAKLKPLAEVRDQVLAAWTHDQQIAQIQKKAVALAKRAQTEQDMTGIARDSGVAVQSSPQLKRSTTSDVFSRPLVQAIFDARPGEVVTGPPGKGDGVIVARVSGVLHAKMAEDAQLKQRFNYALTEQLSNDVTLSLAMDARARQKVQINDQMVNQAVGEGGEGG
jgi:peptidyl-prolyl cis-trans isomerase D